MCNNAVCLPYLKVFYHNMVSPQITITSSIIKSRSFGIRAQVKLYNHTVLLDSHFPLNLEGFKEKSKHILQMTAPLSPSDERMFLMRASNRVV